MINLNDENRFGERYTDYEDKMILLMHNEGATCAKIAAALNNGRTAKAINNHLKKLLSGHKKPSSNISDDEAAEIVRLHFSRYSSSDIVRITGKSDRTVARITRLANVVLRIIKDRLPKSETGGNKP